MASIHRRPRSPYWWGAFRQDGKLVFRSTKAEDRSIALRIVDEWEQCARAAEAGTLVEDQSRKVLNSIMARVNAGTIQKGPTIEAFLKDWHRSRAAARSDSTGERYKFTVDAFIGSIGDRAKRPLAGITPGDIQKFVDHRLKDGVSPTTARMDAKIIRTALNTARRQGLITTNAAEAVELPDGEKVERGTFTPAEVAMLINAADGEWKTLILLAYYSGQRLGDCVGLEWSQVDLAAATIALKQRKTGKSLTVPIHPDLATKLESIATSDKPQQYVMPSMAGLGSGGRHGLSEGFKRIVRKSGLDLGEVQGGGRRKQNTRTFHALRHSFTSALANAGVTSELRMRLTGHSSEAVHKGYTHHELAALKAAVGKLPSLR
jgi:integrase